MLGGLFLILAITFQTGPVEGKTSHLKGLVKSVFVERSTDGDGGTRVPWYRERYDDRSRLAELIFLKDDGSVNNSWIYEYAEGNQLAERELYDSNDLLQWRELFSYDEKGVLQGSRLLSPNGAETTNYYFRYDGFGRKVEKVRREANERQYIRESYKYDSKGQISEELLFAAPGVLDARRVYRYDRGGTLKSNLEYIGNGSLAHHWIYEYKYDSRGNWVEQAGTDQRIASGRSAKTQEIIYRTIVYSDTK